MSAQIKTNAQNADKANELVVETKAEADNGTTQMREMLKAMEEINDFSVSVNKIIKVIDDIAFQTNILALNAAVEAARAGAAGKGFAVVAEEVKNLAQKSAEAAKETTALIEGSITKIGDGSRIVKETATALDRIVKGIENVADLVHSIAQASKEQTQGAEQISQGIIQVSQVIQTNSSISEETAAASEELSGQADLLSEQVAQFKLRKKQLTGSGKRIDNTADNSEGTMLPNKTNTGYTDISLGKY
jgi:methyl-accepting chemotaxis protein